jgi:glycosyltransferase involved in cell wall biosynthesis
MLHDPITLAYSSPGLDRAAVRLVVTLPTFRRPDHLVRTLESIEAQVIHLPYAVIVMDNDAEGQAGVAAASAWLTRSTLKGDVIVAEQRGNCHAYNAGWSTAIDRYPGVRHIAVIDDDELAAPGWLDALVTTAQTTGADLVGGPQRPIFETPADDRWSSHPVFRPPYETTGPVPILYSSGNVLIARRVLEAMPRPYLDPAFNFIGGGDSDFYRRCRNAGFRFAWSAEAEVRETTPWRRTERSWLRDRGLRNGAISALLEKRQEPSPAGAMRRLTKSALMLAASPARGLAMGLRERSVTVGMYRLHVALGRFQAEFGTVNEQYRNPEAN